jgi:hypothetical protein
MLDGAETAVAAIPIRVERLPSHISRLRKRQALQRALALGLSRHEWDRARIESGGRVRFADWHLLMFGRLPEPGELAPLAAAIARATG